MNYEVLKERYEQGRISLAMLKVYVRKGIITEDELKSIIGGGVTNESFQNHY